MRDDFMKINKQKGNAAIILCLVVTALFGFTALALDIGLVYVEKERLSDALDSAALAGALELPDNRTNAVQVAADYLNKNNIDPSQTSIAIGSDGKSIAIDGVKNIKHLFAPVIGINNSSIHVTTKAIIAPVKSVAGGLRPFAVEKADFVYGDVITLKEGAGSGYCGNYGAVALGGTGASVYTDNALYGYKGTISAGQYIDTETGNMQGPTNTIKKYISSEQSTFDNFPRDSIRLWILPLVNSLELNGRSDVQVVGFAEFYAESVNNDSNGMEITGRFIRYVSRGPVDTTMDDTGLYGVKLVK